MHGDQQAFDNETSINEIFDPSQAPSDDDDGEGEDSYLAVMKPSILVIPRPLHPFGW